MDRKLFLTIIAGVISIGIIIGGVFLYSNKINQPIQQLPDLNDFKRVCKIDADCVKYNACEIVACVNKNPSNIKIRNQFLQNCNIDLTLYDPPQAFENCICQKNMCQFSADSTGIDNEETKPTINLQLLKTIKLTNDEDGRGARPEILAYRNNNYVVYLGDITGQRKFKVRIYDKDFNLLKEKQLVSTDDRNRKPTDIRVSKQDGFAYVFYELTDKTIGSAIYGAKYELDDNFTEISKSNGPIIMSRYDFFNTPDGEPTLDDPASVIIDDKLYIMLKIRDKGKGLTNANTLYFLIELNSDFKDASTKELDLSEVMDGWATANSLIFDDDKILHIQSSISGKSDLKMIQFNKYWQYDTNDVYNLTNTQQISETMPMGATLKDDLLFVSYKTGEPKQVTPDNPLNSGDIWLEIFNENYKSIDKIKVNNDNIQGEHSTVEVIGDYVYVAYDGKTTSETKGNIYVNIYKYK